MPALFAAARTAQDLAVRAPFGLSLIFLNVLLEQLGLPVPAIPTLVVAGALAANGQLPLIGVCGLAVARQVAHAPLDILHRHVHCAGYPAALETLRGR